MTKVKRTKRSRFEGVNLTSLNTDAAKVTGQNLTISNVDNTEKKHIEKRKKGRPKSSSRKPLNTAIEPKNKQRLEFLAMLNKGSIADQLNAILEHYFSNVEDIDELIEEIEKRKKT
jgi:hypothetical protein